MSVRDTGSRDIHRFGAWMFCCGAMTGFLIGAAVWTWWA